jgi:hypothetical protein
VDPCQYGCYTFGFFKQEELSGAAERLLVPQKYLSYLHLVGIAWGGVATDRGLELHRVVWLLTGGWNCIGWCGY